MPQEREGLTTTQRLFPDPEPAASKAQPGDTPAAPEDVLDLGKMGGAKVRLKADGTEELVPLADLVRRAGIEKHLTLKGQELAKRENALKEKEAAIQLKETVMKEIRDAEASARKDPMADFSNEPEPAKEDVVVTELKRQIQEMQKTIDEIKTQAAPTLKDNAIKRTSEHIKNSFGVDDFEAYVPKITDRLREMPPQQAQAYDNELGWLDLYKDMKLKELIEASKAAVKPQTRQIANPPPVTGAGGAPTGRQTGKNEQYRALMDKAKKLTAEGSPERHEAWRQVLAFGRSNTEE